jgi:hypothetical protein
MLIHAMFPLIMHCKDINKAKKRLKKQVFIALRQKARNLFLMVKHSNWL